MPIHDWESHMENHHRKRLIGLVEKTSEEGLICLSALIVQGVAIYKGQTDALTTFLLFAALGSYLTLRLLRILGFPKD